MTAPLTPPDCDLRAFRTFPFDIGRFRDSELVSHEEPEAILAAILLWGVAWHQVPAASLPDDDKLLARYAGYGRQVEQWRATKAGALRGFVKCDDGRLYHRVLAEKANESWDQRLKYEWTKAYDRHRKAMKDLAPEERFEFPAFDDWRSGRVVLVPPPRRQGTLEFEPFDDPAPSAPARTERVRTERAHDVTERARTGAGTVPTTLSNGKPENFQRNTTDIPTENALKGEERKGKEYRDSQPTTETVTRVGRLANADLKELYDACCEASGFTTASPEAIDKAFKQIERWKHQGFDFDKTVIPTIKAIVADTTEPTRSLARFHAAISHEHARQKARGELRKAPAPPVSPILSPEGEDPLFKPIRTKLLESLGASTYSSALNEVIFLDMREGNSGPLRVRGPDPNVERIVHGKLRSTVLATAKPLGFTDLWK